MGKYHQYLNNPLKNVRCRPDWSAYTINWGVLCVDLIGPYTYTIKGKDISQCNRL